MIQTEPTKLTDPSKEKGPLSKFDKWILCGLICLAFGTIAAFAVYFKAHGHKLAISLFGGAFFGLLVFVSGEFVLLAAVQIWIRSLRSRGRK